MGTIRLSLTTEDNEYCPDNSAWAYLDANNTLLDEINPGNSVTGRVAWDVPKKTKPFGLLCSPEMPP